MTTSAAAKKEEAPQPITETKPGGTKVTRIGGVLSAIEHADGGREYFTDGKHHRTDGPAVFLKTGLIKYYIGGKLHRTDGPAVTMPDGAAMYFQGDKLHRTDGPAIVHADGTEEYYEEGRLLATVPPPKKKPEAEAPPDKA